MHYAVIYFILFFLRGQGYGLDFKALDPGSRGGAPLRYASPHPKTTRAHNLFGFRVSHGNPGSAGWRNTRPNRCRAQHKHEMNPPEGEAAKTVEGQWAQQAKPHDFAEANLSVLRSTTKEEPTLQRRS